MSRRVWVVGSGGREHALADALLRTSPSVSVTMVPGRRAHQLPQLSMAPQELAEKAKVGADLVVVGPEAPLVDGLADRLRAQGVATLGPSAAAAQLEGSKAFAKSMMEQTNVPTAAYVRCTTVAEAKDAFRGFSQGAAIKADGLAAGKGVIVTTSVEEADRAIESMFSGGFGTAGETVVVEERLEGEELSVIALCDGRNLALMPPSQDHKRLKEQDQGPNTGGMGAYAPAPLGDSALVDKVKKTCMQPIVDALYKQETPLIGVLYAGIMVTSSGPKVLEYNVRFGDPEAQAILPLINEPLDEVFYRAATGALEPRPLAVLPKACCVVVMASAGYPNAPRKGDRITGVDEAEALGVKVYHAGTELNEGQLLTVGGRVLGVSAVAENLSASVDLAYQGVEKIRFEGMQVRADIARRALKT